MNDPIVDGAARKVHYAAAPCQAKNRYVVTGDWSKVTCSFCLKAARPRTETPLPVGLGYAHDECRCGACFRCRTRRRGRQ